MMDDEKNNDGYDTNTNYNIHKIINCIMLKTFYFHFKAFTTLVSNALQIAVINGFGDFILFLGKCFVTATTGSIALLFMRQDPKLHFYAIPIFVVCVFSFFIAHCIISLYEVIIIFYIYLFN